MTEQSWAEGSGSTWESPNGDPRIVPGAEVLLGQRTDDTLYVPSMRKFVGRRSRVMSMYQDITTCKTDCDAAGWNWRARDLVCLRTADGQLTEEGKTLAMWEGWSVTRLGDLVWSPGNVACMPSLQWMRRAGILVLVEQDNYYALDLRRLAMALGEWPPAAMSEPVKVEEPAPAAAKPVEPAPVGAGVCASCGRPLDALSPVDRPPGSVVSYCGDCGFKDRKRDELHVAILRRANQHAEQVWARAADHSGERHLDALRDWLSGPCGRQSWRRR